MDNLVIYLEKLVCLLKTAAFLIVCFYNILVISALRHFRKKLKDALQKPDRTYIEINDNGLFFETFCAISMNVVTLIVLFSKAGA